jgi:hypothetical protein
MFPRDVTFIDIDRLDRAAAAAVETLQMDEDTFRAFYDRPRVDLPRADYRGSRAGR